MRARNFRPVLDRLETRLVMDSGVCMVAGGNLGSSVVTDVGSGGGGSITDVNWYLTGSPPPPSDPTEIAVPWDSLTTTTN